MYFMVGEIFSAEEAERFRPGADELGSVRAPLQHPEAHAEDGLHPAEGCRQEDDSPGLGQTRRI